MAGGNDSATVLLIQGINAESAPSYSADMWEDSSAFGQLVKTSYYGSGGTTYYGYTPYWTENAPYGFFDYIPQAYTGVNEHYGQLYITDFSDFAVGTGPFTIDLRIAGSDVTTLLRIFGNSQFAAEVAVMFENASPFDEEYDYRLTFYIGGSIVQQYRYNTWEDFLDNDWVHLAFERDEDGQCYIYKDGVVHQDAGYTSANTYNITFGSETSYIGSPNDDYWIEEIRFSTVARYGGTNFTPEIEPYDSTPTEIVGEGDFNLVLDIEAEADFYVLCEGDYNVPACSVTSAGYVYPIGVGDYRPITAIEASGTVTIIGTGDYRLPGVQIYGETPGGVGDFNVPSPVVTSSGTVSLAAYGSFSLKGSMFESAGLVTVLGSGSFSVKMPDYSGASSNAGSGSFVLGTPDFSGAGQVLTLVTGTGSYTIKKPRFRVVGTTDDDETLSYSRGTSTSSGLAEPVYSDSALNYTR